MISSLPDWMDRKTLIGYQQVLFWGWTISREMRKELAKLISKILDTQKTNSNLIPDEELKNIIQAILTQKEVSLKDFLIARLKGIYNENYVLQKIYNFLWFEDEQVLEVLEQKMILISFFWQTRHVFQEYSERALSAWAKKSSFRDKNFFAQSWLCKLSTFQIKTDETGTERICFEKWTFEENINKARTNFYNL